MRHKISHAIVVIPRMFGKHTLIYLCLYYGIFSELSQQKNEKYSKKRGGRILLYEKIKKIAGAKGYSINKIEKDLGFSSSYISKLNKSIPSAEKLKKVSDYLGVSMDELLEK